MQQLFKFLFGGTAWVLLTIASFIAISSAFVNVYFYCTDSEYRNLKVRQLGIYDFIFLPAAFYKVAGHLSATIFDFNIQRNQSTSIFF
jgi:hypothetical protein